jgi:hypothetical protein
MNLATAFYGTAADSCVTHRTDQRPTDAFAAGPFRFHAFFFGKIDWTACLIEHGPSGAGARLLGALAPPVRVRRGYAECATVQADRYRSALIDPPRQCPRGGVMSDHRRRNTQLTDTEIRLREHLQQVLLKLRSYNSGEPVPGLVQGKREKESS